MKISEIKKIESFILHRKDKPAFIYNDRSRGWFLHGKIYRIDGPTNNWEWVSVEK